MIRSNNQSIIEVSISVVVNFSGILLDSKYLAVQHLLVLAVRICGILKCQSASLLISVVFYWIQNIWLSSIFSSIFHLFFNHVLLHSK